MPNVSSLVSKAKGLYGTAKGKLDGVKKTIKKVSPAGAVTGAGIGYFTGGLEGTRKSQLDAYNEGRKDGMQKRAANLAASAKKIAKVVGSGVAAGVGAHFVTAAVDRKVNNLIGEHGGIKQQRKNGELK